MKFVNSRSLSCCLVAQQNKDGADCSLWFETLSFKFGLGGIYVRERSLKPNITMKSAMVYNVSYNCGIGIFSEGQSVIQSLWNMFCLGGLYIGVRRWVSPKVCGTCFGWGGLYIGVRRWVSV